MLMERVLVDKPWPDLYDGGREKERGRGKGRRRRGFELNCKTLLRWKWAAKIIERLMGFLRVAQRVAKIQRPIRISKT